MFAFKTLYISALSTPFIAVFISWLVSRQRRRQWWWYFGMSTAVVCVAAVIFAGVSLRSYEGNVLSVALAYPAFSALAVSAFRIRPRFVGLAFGLVLSLPVALVSVVALIGSLAVVLVFEHVDPLYTETSVPGFECHVNSFGDAITSPEGYDVTIKRDLPMLTFLQIVDHTQRFDTEEDEPDLTPAQACVRAYGDRRD